MTDTPNTIPAPPQFAFVCDFDHDDAFDAQALVDAGIAGVLLKASEGHTLKDPKFVERIAASHAAGLLLGAYHFGHDGFVQQQVDLFVGQVEAAATAAGVDPADIRRMLDDEPESATDPQFTPDECPQFLAAVSTPGRPALYYCGLSKGCARWNGAPVPLVMAMAVYPLLLAAYGPSPLTFPSSHLPTPWRAGGISGFQYTDGGAGPADVATFPRHVPGLGGCDHSAFKGSADELRAWWLAPAPPAAG